MEQSFSKADRCYHTGRFGPKAADTERRSISVLTMSGKESQKDIIEGARQLYAAAVKRHKGRQAKPRFDKGTKKKKHPKSEHTFLEKEKASVQKAIQKSVTSSSSSRPPSAEDLQLSAKGMKELKLQNKRRLDRAVEAAENGYLLTSDAGQHPFSEVLKKKATCDAKDNKRIQMMAKHKVELQNKCFAQQWNFKSLGARKTYCEEAGLRPLLLPLVYVSDARLRLFV